MHGSMTFANNRIKCQTNPRLYSGDLTSLYLFGESGHGRAFGRPRGCAQSVRHWRGMQQMLRSTTCKNGWDPCDGQTTALLSLGTEANHKQRNSGNRNNDTGVVECKWLYIWRAEDNQSQRAVQGETQVNKALVLPDYNSELDKLPSCGYGFINWTIATADESSIL